MVDKQKIIGFIRSNGPTLPTEIATHLGESSFIVGALLSELSKSGEVNVSKLKVGGSPLYYLYEHRHKLVKFADYLNEKDKEAHDLLKEKKVLYDKDQTPLLRVSLRTITDFAIPVRVSVNNQEELFWRWYLTPLESVEEKIRARFTKNQPKNNEKETTAEESPKDASKEEKKQPSRETTPKNEQTPQTNEEKEKGNKSSDNSASQQETLQQPEKEEQNTLEASDELDEEVKKFFSKNNIAVNSERVLRKNLEIEYEITVPSGVGDLKFLCRAKSKKKLNETDLTNTYLAGKKKELPVLLITKGDMTKKAENTLASDFPGMKVKKL